MRNIKRQKILIGSPILLQKLKYRLFHTYSFKKVSIRAVNTIQWCIYDKKIYNKEDLAKEVKKRLENAGYLITVFHLSNDHFYMHAESERLFLKLVYFQIY